MLLDDLLHVIDSDLFCSQLTQTSPPEFMSSTLQELGIGTYQNVAMVSEFWNLFQ